MNKKVLLVLCLMCINSAHAALLDLNIESSDGEIVNSQFVDKTTEIALTADFFDTVDAESDIEFEWDFDNDGNTDATGTEVKAEFDVSKGFSFGKIITLTATNQNDNSQLTTTKLIKPATIETPLLTLHEQFFNNFSNFNESENKLSFDMTFLVREDSKDPLKTTPVKVITKVDREYKPFVKIRNKSRNIFHTVESQKIFVDKAKLREAFPNVDEIDIPLHVVDVKSASALRLILKVALSAGSSSVSE